MTVAFAFGAVSEMVVSGVVKLPGFALVVLSRTDASVLAEPWTVLAPGFGLSNVPTVPELPGLEPTPISNVLSPVTVIDAFVKL